MKDLPAPTPDTPTLAGLRAALGRLAADARPRWGRMDAPQMLRHCRVFAELCLGRVRVGLPVRALARLFGPLFLRRLLRRSPRQAPREMTTLPVLRAQADLALDADEERRRLDATLAEVEALAGTCRHPLYGAMRAVDVETLVRHHTAHHANQFGLLDAAPAGLD